MKIKLPMVIATSRNGQDHRENDLDRGSDETMIRIKDHHKKLDDQIKQ